MKQNKYAVIGSPVMHSLSPVIHGELYKIYDINNCIYEKTEVTKASIFAFTENLQKNNICGFNITMPLKDAIIPYLHQTENNFSINTVVVKEGKLYGYSTDTQGFLAGLSLIYGDGDGCTTNITIENKGENTSIDNKNICIIGAGAVAQMFVREFTGATHISIVNRTFNNAKALEIRENITAYPNFSLELSNCDLLINTTPLGMVGKENFTSFSFLDKLPKTAIVYDLLYKPSNTDLILESKKRGLTTQNGEDMLIWQAFYAFKKFFGIMPNYKDYLHIKGILSKYN